MRQIVGQRPDAGEHWNEGCPRVGERELDGLRRRRRLAAQDRGIQVEQDGDEFPAVVQRGRPDEVRLKLHEGVTEQPRLTLEQANERRQVAVPDWWRHRGRVTAPGRDRPADLLHDETLPQADRRRVPGPVFDEVADEGVAPDTSIDVCAEPGIERDGTVPAGVTPRPRARSWHAIVNASVTAARSFPFSSSAMRTASMSPSAAWNSSVPGSRPFRRNSSNSPLARDLRRPSHTDGRTTAPASISSSAHAARVKCSSLIGSKLSP